MAIHDIVSETVKWLNDYGIKRRVMLARILTPIKIIPSYHELTAQLHNTSELNQ